MIFATHQPESATVNMYPSLLKPSPSLLPTASLWVVPEHRLWVSCFKHALLKFLPLIESYVLL